MSKFLWFLGGCATGLLAAAAISVLNEDCSSSSSCDDDEELEQENDESTDEEAPIIPSKHFQATSGFFADAYANDCGS